MLVENLMRRGIHLVAAIGFVVLSAGGSKALAENAWCGSMYGPDGGYVTCVYRDHEQCRMAISGVGGICYLNPEYQSVAPATKKKSSGSWAPPRGY